MKLQLALLIFLFLTSGQSSALTTKELLNVCYLNSQPCHALPFANAYIGGALDLLGALNENELLNIELSCASSTQIFNVKRILKYMEANQNTYEDKNAMLLLIKYLKEEDCVEN